MMGTKKANQTIDELTAGANVIFRGEFVMTKPDKITVVMAVTERAIVIVPTATSIVPQMIIPRDKVLGVTWQKRALSKAGDTSLATTDKTYSFLARREEGESLRSALTVL